MKDPQKLERAESNRETIEASGLNFKRRNGWDVYLFRDGDLKADFYPGTGRWKVGNRILVGDARSFLGWWKNQLIKRSRK